MAQDGALAGEQHRREVLAFARELPMAHRIDASVDQVEPPSVNPKLDLTPRETDPPQLLMPDDAMLARGKHRDQTIQLVRSTFATYSVVFVDLAWHDASIRRLRLREYALR